MNTANLQLEGLLVAVAALTQCLKDRDLLDADCIEAALAGAAETARQDHDRRESLSAANLNAILFPIRFLREANRTSDAASFSRIAVRIGEGDTGSPRQRSEGGI